jgi:tetratricopeptide (TPR) repeat protein
MMEQLDELAEQMDIARVNQRLEKVQKLLERDDAKTGIRECQEALKEYPEHPYVWFLLGQAYLANLDLEEAKQALRQAREASKGGSELEKAAEAHLQQIEQYAPQIILSKAAARMQADDWRTALDILAKGHSLKPRDPQLTFYEAVCWAKIGDVGQAEAIAQEALHQCRKADAQLQAEIENFIPQIPVLLIGEDLHKAQKAMQRKRWRAALKHLDAAVSTSPDAVLALFYKAVCHFRLEEWDEAEGVARKALRLRRATDQEVADQLQSMLHQIPLARVAKDMETVTRAIKRQRWQEALDHLDIVLSRAPEHPVAHFLKAVCLFRSTMAKLNARTTSPRQSLLDPVEAELDEAERWSAGNPELAPQIKVLRSNVSLVRKQLKEAGIYL